MAAAAWALGRQPRLQRLVRAGAGMSRLIGSRRLRLPGLAGRWSSTRITPLPTERSFAEWWQAERGAREGDLDADRQDKTGRQDRSDRQSKAVRADRRRTTGRRTSPVATASGLIPSGTGAGRADEAPGSAREVILRRIRAATAERVEIEVPRDYRRPPGPRPDPVTLFVERVADYRATVRRTGRAGLAEAIADALRAHGTATVAVPADLDPSWTAAVQAEIRPDTPALTTAELDTVDSVITSSALAIAETGTVVLDGGAGQGRRALTLVPDHHVVVVREDQVVAAVPDAIGCLSPSSPQTWISGPSATSDIELNRVEGVHGPRQLDVILVSGDQQDGV